MIEIIKGYKVGIYDIETTGLKADYGHMICGVIKDYKGPSYTYRIDDYDDGSCVSDKQLVEDFINKLNTYDVLVGWNVLLFDKRFLHTRSFLNNSKKMIKPIINRDLLLTPYRAKFLLGSRRLQYVSKIVLGKTTKTFTTPKIFRALIRGEKWAIDFQVDHCRKDVLDTEKLYKVALPFLGQNVKKV